MDFSAFNLKHNDLLYQYLVRAVGSPFKSINQR